jgi:cysteine desulfurase
MIYLDHNATTPVDPAALDAMLPYFAQQFGNASSRAHAWGWAAAEAVEVARADVAELIGADAREIVWTSGATEAANLAIKGVARRYADARGRHLVTCKGEHRAVLDPHARLEREGFEVTYLDVDAQGRIGLDALRSALRPDTSLVSLMRANNETGLVHPTDEIYAICRAAGTLLFVDGTQAPGKIDLRAAHADLIALSAHKMYGPKGVGALWVRRRGPRVSLLPLVEGGGQEGGLRSGTLNVPGIVGMGVAARLARERWGEDAERMARLRDRFEARLLALVSDARVNSAGAPRLPNTSSVTFAGRDAARVMASLRTIALSAGSACSSGSGKPSHVLTAMGLSRADALATLRVSLGRATAEQEMDTAAERIAEAVGAGAEA